MGEVSRILAGRKEAIEAMKTKGMRQEGGRKVIVGRRRGNG